MRKSLLFKISLVICLAFGVQLTQKIQAQTCNLFISEYIEGTSNNKALEFYNPTNSALDLSDYVVYRYNNGSPTPQDSLVLAGHTLAANDVYVAANPQANATILAVADTLHTITFFNGDDVIALYQISTGKIIDKIGLIGVDPGINWTVGNGATSEYTLVRMSSVKYGDSDWTVVSAQWDVYAQDEFGYIGSHTGTACCTSSADSIDVSSCGSYTSPSGKYNWNTSNTYIDTIANTAGCDSIITINLTINSSVSSSISPTTCGKYNSPSGKYSWTTSNTYMDTIKSYNGCDSIITINLTIKSSVTSSISPVGCGSYTSPSGKYTWNTSNTYMDTVKSYNGCDSIITINLTISTNTTSSISPTACNSYTSPSGKVWSISKAYTDTIKNANGCDSIITINLTINNVDTSVTRTVNTFTANQAGATYQWIDCSKNNSPVAGATAKTFNPVASGSYAVVVTLNTCVDTSNCRDFTLVGLNNAYTTNGISIYPNPAQNQIQISIEQTVSHATIRMISITGQLVIDMTNVAGSQFNFDIAKLPQGIYIVEITENGATSRNKFVKQ
jgi:hypothetical protein